MEIHIASHQIEFISIRLVEIPQWATEIKSEKLQQKRIQLVVQIQRSLLPFTLAHAENDHFSLFHFDFCGCSLLIRQPQFVWVAPKPIRFKRIVKIFSNVSLLLFIFQIYFTCSLYIVKVISDCFPLFFFFPFYFGFCRTHDAWIIQCVCFD